MEILNGFSITCHNADNSFSVVCPAFPNGRWIRTSDNQYSDMNKLYQWLRNIPTSKRENAFIVRRNDWSANEVADYWGNQLMNFLGLSANGTATTTASTEPTPTTRTIDCVKVIESFMNFFSEFSFTPSFRFMNTLTHKTVGKIADGVDYIKNYAMLSDDAYKNEMIEKVESKEFKALMSDLHRFSKPTNNINNRLKIYFGSQGTGKTTIAMQETDNRCMVCNSSMLPSDLMEDFDFDSGNPTFKHSILWECMEQGLPVVLDEINLLPFDSLRFLQGITDGKTDFIYKNKPVHIADGFQIIGTMNLSLGGMTYGLPVPLVDRCADIKEFVLTAEQLAKSVLSDGMPTTFEVEIKGSKAKPTAEVEMPF